MRLRSEKKLAAAKLVASALLIAAAWLVALPWLAASTGQREQAETLSAFGIDPTALFYSDHDLADRSHARASRLLAGDESGEQRPER